MSDEQYVHREDEVLLAKLLRESGPWLQRNGTTLIYAVAAVLAVSAVYVYISRQPPATSDESELLLAATTPEQYADAADNAVGTPIGNYARLREAELILKNALSSLFTNRKVGLEELDKAEKTFKRLEESKDLSSDIRLRLLVGMARLTEARCDGQDATVKAAIAAWDQVAKSFPDEKTFAELAKTRQQKLEQQTTRDFYAWFQKQDPKPGEETGLPQDGPGSVPPVPQFPGINPLGNLLTPGTAPATSDTPAAPQDPQPEPKAEEPKAEEPKAEEPKAEEPKAEEPKAEEPKAEEPKAEEPKAPAPAEKTSE
ncbi:MAG: hypothetical protein RIT02_299 [Planctomycetota bacterium]